MSNQFSGGRRAAALAAAANLGPISEDVAKAIEAAREKYAAKRAERRGWTGDERRKQGGRRATDKPDER